MLVGETFEAVEFAGNRLDAAVLDSMEVEFIDADGLIEVMFAEDAIELVVWLLVVVNISVRAMAVVLADNTAVADEEPDVAWALDTGVLEATALENVCGVDEA